MTSKTANIALELERIAIEDTQRWLMAAVIGLNLCPFAKAVVVKDKVRYRVCLSSAPQDVLQMLAEELQFLASADASLVETTLLIAPFALSDFLDFNQFLSECDAMLASLGLVGELQVADFHPDYEFAGEPPHAMGHFTNRSPYPTLHLLRESSIDEAVALYPDAALIFERNIASLELLGAKGWADLGVVARLNGCA
ncbi:MAG: DUF1415 domain-containing protein [Betaproteobacteria bacterium]|nr:DUF1415 domain-containing protein [Betaproteobacteria bacterium]